ncbi:MAG: putative sulfate exporter family transporter [Lentisphaeria bacterium]|nr:putative sulfate exporter family transporter [Lentisphaeria bacterium]
MKKIIFIFLAIAFFALPWLWSPAKDWAPGLAVLAGILFSVIWGNPYSEYTSKITSPLLGATIVGMGFGMNLIDVLHAGANGFFYTLIGIIMGIGFGVLAGKLLALPKNAIYLVSVGTSICGGSAIAAAAPVLKAKSHEIAMASATVFTLNAIALWIFPIIGQYLGFSQHQFGYWAALGIHDTSSVVGATMAYGEEALGIGTTVKLARALWIVPVTLFLSWFIADKEDGEKKTFKLKIPWFIPCFIAAAAIVTWLPALFPAKKLPVPKQSPFSLDNTNTIHYP